VRIGITSYPTVGGSGAVAAELGQELARRDHEIHFVTQRLASRPAEYQENVRYHEVEISSLLMFEHPPADLALAAKMAEVARENRLELFHVHYAIPHAVTGFLAQQMLGASAPRLVTTLHGTDITLVGQDRSFYEITRFGIERSDAVTAVSEFLQKMTAEELNVQRPIEVIPNFVDVSTYCPARAYKDRRKFCGPGDRLLLHASNFRPMKRVLDVVRILERVNREVPAVLLMLGEGPERASAQALARRLSVSDRVRFLGRQESVAELTGMADVFLMPSELESFGLAALEAMACGVPVVGSDAGGLAEVVKHTETGFLLPVGDVDGMAARTLEILKDEQRRRGMGAAGRRRTIALFSADRVVSQYERLYERVLGSLA
jgi:N-acetyl-alpha-D-glucosaminyl L-malate synthase BshA